MSKPIGSGLAIRVLVVDDHEICRAGIVNLLRQAPGVEVVAESEDGTQGIATALKVRPDVVVFEMVMRGLHGPELARAFLNEVKDCHLLALSRQTDRQAILDILDAGAIGYVHKDSAPERLHEAIRSVAAGKTYLGDQAEAAVIDEYLGRLSTRRPGKSSVPAARQILSNREREILQLIAEEMSTKQVAEALGLSAKTVEAHRRNIMQKTGIHTIAGLTKYAVREGLVSLAD